MQDIEGKKRKRDDEAHQESHDRGGASTSSEPSSAPLNAGSRSQAERLSPPREIPRRDGPPRKGPPSSTMDPQALQEALWNAEYHHVTPGVNLESIETTGLQTSFSGAGGMADAALAANPNDPLTQERAKYFNELSKGSVYLSKGDEANNFYQQTLQQAGADPIALTAYLPKSAKLLMDDRHREKGFIKNPYDEEQRDVPAAYRSLDDIPPSHISRSEMELSRDPTLHTSTQEDHREVTYWEHRLRPPLTQGADNVPDEYLNAIRTHLPSDYQSNTKLREGLRRTVWMDKAEVPDYGSDVSSMYDTTPSSGPSREVSLEPSPGSSTEEPPRKLARTEAADPSSSVRETHTAPSDMSPSRSRAPSPSHGPPSMEMKRGPKY